ncbi:histone-fold-containing protein [Pterulicium gracile]|uniref:Histone-fold-containing protein n=1 Tax=Pterulicium gracile TaxID=1884261 RepID=A0A5C3R5J2_9AGAR|nr:histone-fold-containing protein [Pterula gracilis]
MTPSSSSHQPYVQAGDALKDFLPAFWRTQIDEAEQETPDYRHPPLPLARIKKVMKSDPEVKMIAADAPIIFCKACEIFISEVTARAFIVADANKRRTLNKADIAKALSKSDQFDFLIDFMPRADEAATNSPATSTPNASTAPRTDESARQAIFPTRPPLPRYPSTSETLMHQSSMGDESGDGMVSREDATELYTQLDELLRNGVPPPR